MTKLIDSSRSRNSREEYTDVTRKASVDAVSDAFAAHGFAGASTEAISHAASAKR